MTTAPSTRTDDRHTYVRTVSLDWPKGKGPELSIKGGTMAAPVDIPAVAAHVDLRYTWYADEDDRDGGYWSGPSDVMVHRSHGKWWGDRTRPLDQWRNPEVKSFADHLLEEHHPRTVLTITEAARA